MFGRFIATIAIALFLSAGIQAAEPAMGKAAVLVAVGTYKVTAIDHKTREVTLQDEEGNSETFVIGKEARNLDQVNVGDIVTVKAAEGIAVELVPAAGSVTGIIERTGISRSEKGQKPHGAVYHHVELIGQIEALDKKKREVTIRGKDATITVPVADDVDLDKVSVGDTVRIDILEMISITVDAGK